jgi:hypothetical protein
MRSFSRDPRIDFIRGIAVISMVVQHVGGISFLSFAFGAGAFDVSAAEVFVFLSGLVTARAALKTAHRAGTRTAAVHLLKRAGRLYVLTVGLTLLTLPLLELIPLPWAQGLDLGQPMALVVSVLTLHQTGYVVDIPLMYTLLVALAAVVVPLLHAGHTRPVLLASFGLWLAYQLMPAQAELPWAIAGNRLFPVSAWQLIFCAGLTVGHHWDALRNMARPHARGRLLWAAGMATLGFVLLFVLDHAFRFISSETNELLFGKSHVGVGRIVATMAVLGFGFLLTAAAWDQLVRAVGWFVLPLGRNSLRCYVLHVPVVYGAAIVLHAGSPVGLGARTENTLLQVGALLLIWIAVRAGYVRLSATGPAPLSSFAVEASRAARAFALTIFRF